MEGVIKISNSVLDSLFSVFLKMLPSSAVVFFFKKSNKDNLGFDLQ